jgi:PAS domain S-box-containing protein
MPQRRISHVRLVRENAELRRRLAEAEETLHAIHTGEVDALVVSSIGGDQVFTLKGADQPYRMLIEDMNEGALTLTMDGVILYANRRFAEMLKAPLEKVIGSAIRTWIAPADYKMFQALLRRDATPTHYRGEITIQASDGAPVPGYFSTTFLQKEEMPGLFCLVATDLTEQKRNETLVAAEKLARSILDQAAEAIVVCDAQGQILRASEAAHVLCGQNPLGLPFAYAFPLCQGEGVAFSLAESVATGNRSRAEVSLQRNGQVKNLLISVGPLLGAQSEQLGNVIALIDITERKRAEVDLRERDHELEAVVMMSAALRLTRTRAEMLPIIADHVTNLVSAASVALLANDDYANDALPEYVQGVWANDQGKHLPRTSSILRQVLVHGTPYLSNDVPNDPAFSFHDVIPDVRAFVGIPLVTHEAVIGVLAVAGRTVFSEQDIRVLSAISDIAANAMHRAALHEQTERDAAELAQAYDATLEGWAHALELRDQETEGHSRRVVQLSINLARAMGIGAGELEHIRRGALLHDIGKMGVPDSVLLKPGTLNEREWEMMRRHPEYAYTLLSPIAYLQPALDIPYCHHEKWDGTGYPRGLKGEEIPLAARIFAIVDVWDALRSDRPYRQAWTEEQVRAYLQSQSGTHFEPRIVDAFLSILAISAT